MPKVTKVGKFRAKATASAGVRRAPAAAAAGVKSSTPSRPPVAAKKTAPPRPEHDATKATPSSPSGASDEKTTPAPSSSPPAAEKTALSRGQRKRQAKKDQYLRRNRMVMSTLQLKREEEQRGKLDGLDAIREALRPIERGGVGAAAAKSSGKEKKGAKDKEPSTVTLGTNRAKKDLVGKETAHMGMVLEHPDFASDPFGAIKKHLQNSLAGQAEELRVTSEARQKEEERAGKEKKEAKKEKIRAARVGTRSKWRGGKRQVGTGSTGRGGRNRR